MSVHWVCWTAPPLILPSRGNREKARLARETEKRKIRRMPKQIRAITLETSSVAGPSDQARRVVIDGATFEFDKDGQRLKRIEGGRIGREISDRADHIGAVQYRTLQA